MIVQDNNNGFILDSNEPNLFYQSLVNLVENETLRADFGNALFNTVQSEYTAESVIKKYLNWLQNS